MYFGIRMIKNWEDLGMVFKKGKAYLAREMEIESEFYTNGYYVIPKKSCRKIKKEGGLNKWQR